MPQDSRTSWETRRDQLGRPRPRSPEARQDRRGGSGAQAGRGRLLRGCLAGIVLFAGTLALVAAASAAQVVELLDSTKISGQVVHFYDGILTVETADGTLKLPQDKIRRIVFELPKPRPAFSTPEKTFNKWESALKKGRIDEVIDCYALMFQGMLASQMGGGEEMINQMKKEIAGTAFTIKGAKQKGDRATLTVLRKKGDTSETGEIAFVRENKEWKMLPPMNLLALKRQQRSPGGKSPAPSRSARRKPHKCLCDGQPRRLIKGRFLVGCLLMLCGLSVLSPAQAAGQTLTSAAKPVAGSPKSVSGPHKGEGSSLVVPPILWHRAKGQDRTTVVLPAYFRKTKTVGETTINHQGILPALTFWGRTGGVEPTEYRVQFPFFWQSKNAQRRQTVIPPLVYWSRDDDGVSGALFPLVFARTGKTRSHLGLFPLFYTARDTTQQKRTTIVPFYRHQRHGNQTTDTLFPFFTTSGARLPEGNRPPQRYRSFPCCIGARTYKTRPSFRLWRLEAHTKSEVWFCGAILLVRG